MEQQSEEPVRESLEELEDRLRRAEPKDVPQPEPGVTAPVDEVSEDAVVSPWA
jgi:hypothetical protein